MITYNLFPTAVAKFELGRDYTAEELAFVDEQPTHSNMGNTTSDDRYVLRHDTMANLKAFAEASSVMNFDQIDRAPEDLLNRVLWHAMRGSAAAYPAWAVVPEDEDDEEDEPPAAASE